MWSLYTISIILYAMKVTLNPAIRSPVKHLIKYSPGIVNSRSEAVNAEANWVMHCSGFTREAGYIHPWHEEPQNLQGLKSTNAMLHLQYYMFLDLQLHLHSQLVFVRAIVLHKQLASVNWTVCLTTRSKLQSGRWSAGNCPRAAGDLPCPRMPAEMLLFQCSSSPADGQAGWWAKVEQGQCTSTHKAIWHHKARVTHLPLTW